MPRITLKKFKFFIKTDRFQMYISSNTALIPYTKPMTPMEFIQSEVERGLKNGTILPFIPSQFLRFYGLSGQETVKKMAYALKSHSLQIIYNDQTRKFTVLESSSIPKKAIEKIFSGKSYQGWIPKVLDEVDPFGNRLVELCVELCMIKDQFSITNLPA